MPAQVLSVVYGCVQVSYRICFLKLSGSVTCSVIISVVILSMELVYM